MSEHLLNAFEAYRDHCLPHATEDEIDEARDHFVAGMLSLLGGILLERPGGIAAASAYLRELKVELRAHAGEMLAKAIRRAAEG